MGIPETQAKHAVYNTGNSNAENASMWFFENIENPAIQMPLRVKKQAAQSKKECDPESVIMIESMGFTSKQAERALRKCDGNVERACDWIFSHMDEPASDDGDMQVDQDSSQPISNLFATKHPDQGSYDLKAFITHLGTSVHAGHYVCHIRKLNDWIYYNDAKVAVC